jgi:peptidoglycan/LPS O-acetylase OafA/YrhL
MVQLDGIRGLAVLGVLAWHWLTPWLRYCPVGIISVRVFFVLSGFLITGILLRSRRQREEMGLSWREPLRHFYIRRMLRIFPLYYLIVVMAIAGGISSARDGWYWHVFYLSNFAQAFDPNAGGSTGHFWSLSVEEQFYMVWPWLALFMPRRSIPWMAVAMVVIGPVYRGVVLTTTHNYSAAAQFPFACLDSLGAGALLAWGREESRFHPDLRSKLTTLCGYVGVPLFALAMLAYNLDNVGTPYVILIDLGVAMAAAWLISRASRGIGGPVGRFLEFPPLVYMGTISYCVYLIHPFIHNLSGVFFRKTHVPAPGNLVHILLDLAVTVMVATASWYLFERRLVRLGRTLTPDPVKALLGQRGFDAAAKPA